MFLCGTMLMTVAALYAASLSAEFKASQIPLQVRISYAAYAAYVTYE